MLSIDLAKQFFLIIWHFKPIAFLNYISFVFSTKLLKTDIFMHSVFLSTDIYGLSSICQVIFYHVIFLKVNCKLQTFIPKFRNIKHVLSLRHHARYCRYRDEYITFQKRKVCNLKTAKKW